MDRDQLADEQPSDDRAGPEADRQGRLWTFTLCTLCSVPAFLVGLAIGAFAVGNPSDLFRDRATHTHGQDVPPEAKPFVTSPTADKATPGRGLVPADGAVKGPGRGSPRRRRRPAPRRSRGRTASR
jgi:hypothetical protein